MQIQSQDVLHSPKYYSVIWRTRLKPVHEYFPAQYNQKKEYINNIIHKCSILVFSDSLFRLRNIRSGDYLGRQSLESSSHLDTGVIAIPSNNNNKSIMNASNIFWKFNDSITAIEQSTTPYIFVGNNKFLYSGQQSTGKKEATLLSRSNNPGASAFDRSITPQSRAGIKLIQYKQPKGGQLKSTLRDMDESWKWSIGTISNPVDSATDSNHHQEEIFNLDGAINNNRCIIHGDEITLNQQSFYLRAASGSNYSTFNFSRPESNNSPPFIAKSPLSIISYGGDQYNFSPQGMMSDSNSTQPTSGSNSSFNSLSMQNNSKVTEYTKSRNIINPSPLQQQQQNNSIVFTEKLIRKPNTLLYPLTEYRWRVEMISKSLMDEQEEIVKVIKRLSLKSNISNDIHHHSNNTIEKTFKPYSPKLNPDIARFNSPDTTTSITRHYRHNNAIQALIDSSHLSPLISSVVIVEDNNPQKQQALLSLQQKYSPQPPQKSKWLDVNPQLYDLQRQTTLVEENNSNKNIPSRYSSAQEKQSSVKTVPSPTSSLLPEISEKKLGKQPLQQPKIQFTSNYNNHRRRPSPDSDDSAWTSSPVDKNDIVDLNIVSTPTPLLTEAEAFKRGIQQSYKDKDEANKAQNIIFKNLFAPSLRSNTTSQMWNCDDDDEIIDHGSSQVRTYTMTPRSKYSQQFTPSSSANLTPEEYIQRRKNREQSFLLLVDRETTQQLWLRAFKESALNNWLKYLSPSTRIIKQYQKRNTTTAVNTYSNSNSNSIRSHRKSKSGNRIIQKKKPFYKKSNNRRQEGIVI